MLVSTKFALVDIALVDTLRLDQPPGLFLSNKTFSPKHCSSRHCSCRHKLAIVDKPLLKHGSYRQNLAPADIAPFDKTLILSIKLFHCRQNSAPTNKIMLLPNWDKTVFLPPKRPNHNTPVGMFLSIKLFSGRHSIAPVDNTMLLSTKQSS